MKFGLFYQLPCAPNQDEVTRYRETLEQIVYADELGFDTAWMAELHFNPRFSIMPAPLLVAANLAAQTRRIRLGLAVALLPLEHPLRTAEEAATVDVLSQGRLDLGVGRGTIALHFEGFGVPRAESRGRFEEALSIIKQAWTQDSCAFEGTYYHIPRTVVVPKPRQKPHPPLRIAANSPESTIFAAQGGYPMFAASVINPMAKLIKHVDLYRRTSRTAGHGEAMQDVAVLAPVYVTTQAEQSRRQTEASCMHYFRTVSHQAGLGTADGAESYAYLREVRQRMQTITWEEVDTTMAFYGAPDACIRKLTEAHARCHLDQIICWFNPGGLVPHQQVLDSMRLFAEEVMPAVRHL
ncbi:Alkanal monooxygenase alpha chain [Candidatus Entotheonellaceae bacterium PAL068K]